MSLNADTVSTRRLHGSKVDSGGVTLTARPLSPSTCRPEGGGGALDKMSHKGYWVRARPHLVTCPPLNTGSD